jgi:hypothetical protein
VAVKHSRITKPGMLEAGFACELGVSSPARARLHTKAKCPACNRACSGRQLVVLYFQLHESAEMGAVADDDDDEAMNLRRQIVEARVKEQRLREQLLAAESEKAALLGTQRVSPRPCVLSRVERSPCMAQCSERSAMGVCPRSCLEYVCFHRCAY